MHIPKHIKTKLSELRTELNALDLTKLAKTTEKALEYEKHIKSARKRGLSTANLEDKLTAYLTQIIKKFETQSIPDISQEFDKLDQAIQSFDLKSIEESINDGLHEASQVLKNEGIDTSEVNAIAFEDYSGRGNLLMYGFKGTGLPFNHSAESWDDALFEEVAELDFSSFYDGMELAESFEVDLADYEFSRLLNDYADSMVEICLHNSVKNLLSSGAQNQEILKNSELKFYHNHHDADPIVIYP